MGLSERLLKRQTVGKELQPFPPFSCPLLEVQSSQIIKYLKDSGLGIGWRNKGNKRTLSSVQFTCSVVSNSSQPQGLQHTRLPCPSPSPSLLKCTLTESVMPSNHLILCRPLLLLPLVFPSIGVFSNESALLITWPMHWSFSFSISPSSEYSGLISFRMDWLDLLAGHRTLKSLLQHHSLKTSVRRCSAFFMVQLSHPYMTTGKTIALTKQTFVSKVMSLLFNPYSL